MITMELSCNIQPSRGAATGQTTSCHSELRVWGPRSSSSCSCTCICITNHFFSLTDTAASASAVRSYYNSHHSPGRQGFSGIYRIRKFYIQ
jgi:hypothetical protein